MLYLAGLCIKILRSVRLRINYDLNKIMFIKLNPIIEPPPNTQSVVERIYTTSITDRRNKPTLKHVLKYLFIKMHVFMDRFYLIIFQHQVQYKTSYKCFSFFL